MSHAPLEWITEALSDVERQKLRRRLRDRWSPQAATIRLDDRDLLNFASNDYLGLAADPRLKQAIIEAVDAYGWGAGASALITGHSGLHRELERALAAFENVPAALVFPTGYAANVGTISALAGPADVIFSDAKNHASIIDGCRLARASSEVYRHNDVSDLERRLQRTPRSGRTLIVTDGLFSMDGDVAPLAELADMAEKYDAMLMVDEAHATGVFGAGGRGTCEHSEIEDRVHIRVGTLSKALGSLGGFVAGAAPLIEWLVNKCRPYIFSTAAPAAVCAAGIAALRIVDQEPHRRRQLLARAAQLRQRLTAQGWNVGSGSSQIIPVILGAPRRRWPPVPAFTSGESSRLPSGPLPCRPASHSCESVSAGTTPSR